MNAAERSVYLARIEAENRELRISLREIRTLSCAWMEGLVTDAEAYWRLREILCSTEFNEQRIYDPKVVKR